MTPRLLRAIALAGVLFGLLVGLAPRGAAAAPYSVYRERQQGETLIIEHTPAPGIRVARVGRRAGLRRHRVVRHRVARSRIVRRARLRNVANPAIAGFCREGGARYERDPVTGGRRIIQREVCDSVAWYSQAPNNLVVRPPTYAAQDYSALAQDRLRRRLR